MPLLHDSDMADSGRERTQSWAPEEFTSVALPGLAVQPRVPAQTLEPVTLTKIDWAEKLPALKKTGVSAPATTGIHSGSKPVTNWQLPEISQFVARTAAFKNTGKQPGMNAALDCAAQLKAEAEKTAAQIIEKAQADAREIEAASLQEAELRRQQGYGDGVEAARKEAVSILKMAQNVLEEAYRWQQQTMTESEPAIIEMLKSISQDLFGEGFVLNLQEIEGVITRAISQASRLGDLRVYMNPDDAMQLISLWQESEIILNGQKIALVSSQNIQRGGCFIDGQYGMVDSRVPDQLAQIHKTLDGTLADRTAEQE